ncbi:MAG: NAD(+) synthase [Verrucomicrobia bacterium]|nr:NAD(+) synthase [Verrucomicrobiota bacterium]
MTFSKESIRIDPAAETQRLVEALRVNVRQKMRRGGAVFGISGGVDSAVVLSLAVQAFGPERVTAIMLPEKDSDPLSERLARELAAQFGITPLLECITEALDGFGCYRRRDEAVRRLFPEYDAAKGWKMRITLPSNLMDEGTLNVFALEVITPDGRELSRPLPAPEFLQVVAASNFKQRTRMSMLYYHAELKNYAVLGTANKNEHDQGFFVKHGDSGVDVKVIGHLYKSQIYQLADHLQVPQAIRNRPPTSDTYSAPCDQQDFFFRLPFETMDLLWLAQERGVSAAEAAEVLGFTEKQVQRAFDEFARKHRTTEFLRMNPLPLG